MSVPVDSSCIFCKIISGGLAAHKVFEDEASVAFLDNHPLFPGHVLLSPRGHYETLPDVPAEQVGPLFQNAQLLSKAVKTGLGAEGTFVAINNVVSQTVPHLHVHIVPRKRKDGLKGFFWPRNAYRDQDEINSVCEAIRAEISKLRTS